MRNVNLEENELTITAIFQQHTKEETIQTLKEALEVLEQEESDPENDEIIEIINSTVGKLQQIEDKYYYSLDLNYYLNNLEDDAYEACGFSFVVFCWKVPQGCFWCALPLPASPSGFLHFKNSDWRY